MIRHILATAILAPLLGLVAPVVSPAIAEDAACTTWTVGMVEDEGGEVLAAQACAIDRPDAYMSLTCFSGEVSVRYDLELGDEAPSESDDNTDITFATTTDSVTLPMAVEEMDGMHAAYIKAADPLLQLLKAGDTVAVSDVPGHYPAKHFSLKGSSAALGKLVPDCS